MMQRRLLSLCLFAGALAATGCRETTANPDYCGCDLCVIADGGACTHRDAGPDDGGDDGDGGDAGEDAGPTCELTCVAPNVCDPADACVPCYDDPDAPLDPGCTEEAPVCSDGPACIVCDDTGAAPHDGCTGDADRPYCVDGTCEGCRTHADCVVGDLVICDPEDHVCRRCEEAAQGADCADANLGRACLEGGICAACDDTADCDGRGCDPRTNECSVANPGTIGQCEPCVSDLDCADSSSCVEVRYPVGGGPDDVVGTYCAATCPELPDDCLDVTFSRGYECANINTRSGVLGDFCIPSSTTCEAYRQHNRNGCEGVQGVCSHDGDGGDNDGACAGGTCTYPCFSSADCPGGYACGGDLASYCDFD